MRKPMTSPRNQVASGRALLDPDDDHFHHNSDGDQATKVIHRHLRAFAIEVEEIIAIKSSDSSKNRETPNAR